MIRPRVIAITGASSGIGVALALFYAESGVTLHLQGRDGARLERIAAQCRKRGAGVDTAILDVTDEAAVERWLLAADTYAPIDLVIANAGISAGSGEDGESAEQARRVFAVNVGGVLNTILPLLPLMAGRGRGQIALMSSLAGMRGLPGCPAYSASKACVRAYGEALRGWLGQRGVEVCVICPGYIRTPMTDANRFPMPFLMTADKAARIIAAGLARNRPRIAFPLAMYLPLWLLSCLSPRLTDPIFSRLPAKPSHPAE